MEWCPARWSVCLPLLIFLCAIKSRSSLLALAHPGGPGKKAIKRLWWWWWGAIFCKTTHYVVSPNTFLTNWVRKCYNAILGSHLPRMQSSVFGRPFVKRFTLCYRSIVLFVCLSVCLSDCNVRALWPNGWTDQDETWHAGRPWPWPHCVRWGPSSPSPKGAQPPIFGPYLLRTNGCMHGSRCHLVWS